MLFKSPIFAQASGSVGGLTFSHNRGGQYTRARVTPTDPTTQLQVAIRNAMTALAVRWNETLTPAQRTAWETYASNVEMTNRLGDTIFLTGQQQYLRSNIPRVQIEATPVDDGPTIFDLGLLTPPTPTATAPSTINVGWTTPNPWLDETGSHLIIYASIEKSPTINYFVGPYQFIGTVDGDDTTAPTPPEVMTSPSALTAGNRVFVRGRVTRVDGRLSGNIDMGPILIS